MTTATTTIITDCTVCGGTGYDEAFGNPCDCLRHAGRYGAARARFNPGRLPAERPLGSPTGTGHGAPTRMASDKQMAFIRTLLGRVQPATEMQRANVAKIDAESALPMTAQRAHRAIDFLMAMSQAPVATAAAPARTETGLDLAGLPSGTYAIPGGDTRLKVKVEQGEGKWTGWTFVKDGAEYGMGKKYGAQRPGQKYRGDITAELAIILADPRAAMAAYGQITSRCGVCGRKLENEESVARGIGPHCAGLF